MSLQIIHDGTVIFDDDVTEIRMSENVHGELKLEASFEPVKCAAALAETLGVKFI